MSRAFTQSKVPSLGPDTAAVLSLESEQNRARRKGRDLAQRLLLDLQRKHSSGEGKRVAARKRGSK